MLKVLKYILPIITIVVAISIIINIYNDFRARIISDFNNSQIQVLRQSSRDLSGKLDNIERNLQVLASTEAVRLMKETGVILCRMSLQEDPDVLKAITRMSKDGRITFTYPPNPDVIGMDITWQEHVKQILNTRQTVFSDIFNAVQGYRAVAVHVPVFDGLHFDGSLAFLLSYDDLIEQFTSGLGESSEHFVLMNSKGTILCAGDSSLHGKNLYKYLNLPGTGNLNEQVKKGESSFTWERDGVTYFVNLVSSKTMDVRLTWITLNRMDNALSGLSTNFRRLMVLMAMFTILLIGFIAYASRKWYLESGRRAMAKVNKQLKASEIRFQKLFEILPDAIFISEKEGNSPSRIVNMNSTAVIQTGYSREELLGKNVAEFLSIESLDDNSYKERTRQIIAGSSFQMVEKKRKKDGTEYWTSVHFAVMEDEGKKFIISVNRDITEQINMQDKLIQSQKMESIGILTGAIAHDFNNILTAVNGFSELGMMMNQASEENYKLFENIYTSGEHARNLIRQLLVFSKQQTGSRKTVNLNRVVSNLYPMMVRVLKKDIELTLDLSETDLFIYADPGHLEQILLNLVLNANDALDSRKDNQNKSIRIKTGRIEGRRDEKNILVSVEDNGAGIDNKVLPKIFDPFFTTKKSKGTGLGLYTVYKLAEKNYGETDVESVPGKGTVIQVRFPESTETVIGVDDEQGEQKLAGGSETLLFVEDNSKIVDFIETALKSLGYKLLVAFDGQEGLDTYNANPDVQLIITDIDMPKMNGIEFGKAVESLDDPPPIIFTSGYADTVHGAKDFLALRKDRYLLKPYSLQQLDKKIRELLERQ